MSNTDNNVDVAKLSHGVLSYKDMVSCHNTLAITTNDVTNDVTSAITTAIQSTLTAHCCVSYVSPTPTSTSDIR